MHELVVVATGRRIALHTGLQPDAGGMFGYIIRGIEFRGFRTRQTSREGEGALWGHHGRRYGQGDTHATGPDPRGHDEGIRRHHAR
jgi:hypothetical protein